MKLLTADEFQDRLQAFNRATRIFGELTGQNITKAFEAYQAILSETQREIHMDVRRMQGMTGSPFDELQRPACIDCGSECNLRQVPDNDEGIKSQVVCTQCDLVLDSELSIQEWLNVLPKRKE